MEGLGLEEVPVTSPELDELLFSGILESCAAGGGGEGEGKGVDIHTVSPTESVLWTSEGIEESGSGTFAVGGFVLSSFHSRL